MAGHENTSGEEQGSQGMSPKKVKENHHPFLQKVAKITGTYLLHAMTGK